MSKIKQQKELAVIPDERIVNQIFFIRGQKVMFDRDLAELYGVKTRILNQAMKRNLARFPADFAFQLNKKEADIFLRSQIVILENDPEPQSILRRKGRGKYSKFLPYVFTEQGVAMLSAVLKSERAILISIQIVRIFVKLRQVLSLNKDLSEKIEKMERKYDTNFKMIFQVIARLMKEDTIPKGKIGFK
ncbi:MAG: hypothetical protein A2288_01965 [Candidatus Moranbacteria bacterium RIFOXYA12_FULL_44_15]|nr:MAG: hypothetical protein A2288_01965 [Candidatus Moranbacteria bacterium RIFOXYA12_FULL_44_15]OGI35456.1 MAG: hypothetical protein A2259_02410 [Candidatus Moranbacteria bacterium RIFOXYA2_FULL_43_15]